MIEKITSFFESKVAPVAAKIQKMKYIKVLQNGFFATIAFTTIGSLVLVLITPAISSDKLEPGIIQSFILGWEALANVLRVPCMAIYNYTVGISSLYHSFAFGYFTGTANKKNGVLSGITALTAFLVATSITADGSVTTAYFGTGALFACIIISIAAVELMSFLTDKKIGVIDLAKYGVPPTLADSFAALIPVSITLIAAAVLGNVCINTVGPIPDIMAVIMTPLLKFTDNIWFVSICAGLMGLFWWFGIHDGVFFAALPMMQVMQLEIVTAWANGTPLNQMPYTGAQYFYWMYYLNYGILALAILCLFSKSKQLKTIGRVGVVPAIFNISEPMVFGLPIMFNPYFLIPYVFVPAFNVAVAYIFVDGGLVNQIVTRASMQLPYPIMALLGSLDVKAMILVIVLLIIDGIIYYPFFKMYEKETLAKEAEEGNE